MRNHTLSSEQVHVPYAEPGEDDSQAPSTHSWRQQRARRARRVESRGRPTGHKAWQLCRQVAVTLDEVLAECGDGVLRGLRVVSVAPFPDASRLLVTLTSIDDRPGGVIGAGSVLEHIEHAAGHLRCEIASAVTRKRAPVLVYQLVEPRTVEIRTDSSESVVNR
jgi:ribosome-binding factor A